MAEIPDNKNKLLVLFFAISACIALAFYVGIVKNETIFYFHFFYIPTILAGIWYHRKAVYVALGLGMVHIVVTFFSLHPVSLNEFGRAAILITVAYIIGFTSERRAKAEKELLVSDKNKDYLDNIIKSSVDAIVVVDMNGIVRSWNKGAEGYMGYTADEMIGASNRKFFRDQKETDRIMEMVQRNGEVKNYRTIVLSRSGKPVHISMSAALLRDRNGMPIGTIRMSRDITKEVEMEEKNKIERENMKSIFASMADGVYIVSKDYKIEFMNKVMMDEWGEHVGSICYKEFHNKEAPCPQCKSREVFKGQTVRWERRSHRKNKTYDLTETPVKNIDGTVSKLTIFRDITERKRAMETLKKLSNAVEQGADSVIITDKDDVVDYVNPAFEKLTGYTREEAIGRKPNILKSGKHDKKFYEILYETIHSGRVYRGEIINKKKNGEIYLVASTITPITDMQGNITHFVSTEKDITDRKKAEEQLRASLKEKEVLLREIHHRVKNNIQVISSMLSLQSEYITEEKYRDMFRESQNRILSMALIHEKLYQSRDFAKIDLNEYIKELVNDLFLYYGIDTGIITHNINVENVSVGIESAIPCGLIINELVTNSLKHAFPDGRKGELKISFRSIGESMIELVISDNGIGIPKDLDFENTQSMGMYLVKILAENQLQGEIDLDRSKGTEFKIEFKGERNNGKTNTGC